MGTNVEYQFTVEDIASRLISDFGYGAKGANSVAEKLVNADLDIREAFYRWWEAYLSGSPIEVDNTIEIGGWTARRLVADRGVLVPGSYADLTWLRHDPTMAQDYLKRNWRERKPSFRSVPGS